MRQLLLIKYGELTTKKDNRNTFINILCDNIHKSLNGLNFKIIKNRVRMFIECEEIDLKNVINKLQKVFGIHCIVVCDKVNNNISDINEKVISILRNKNFNTFKVETNRSNKQFALTSPEISRQVGASVLKNLNCKVDVHNPDIIVYLEVREDNTYIYLNEYKGAGGYPVGVQGKGLLMLSGGIDSPVAGYLAMKRGISVQGLYFESPPHTNIQAKEKVLKLGNILNEYSGNFKIHVAHFTKVQEEIYKKLEDIIESYIKGIDVDNNNIYLDDDDLIVSGTQNTQNTWMDAKYDGVAITPRSGKAVEVNSLWYNANKIMADLSKKFGHSQNAKKYKLIAEKCKKSFNDKFYNKRRKCLYDVLGDSKIRPNQLFALSLTYPVIEADSEEAKNIISVVEKKLLNAYGLKTLAKGEENYVEVYEGDGKKRDSSYHQGITWPWLLGLYYNALKNILKKTKKKDAKKELETKLEKFIEKTSKTFQKEISHNGCIGSISELYDSRKPYLPKGTIAQAWSVAEVFRIILNK